MKMDIVGAGDIGLMGKCRFPMEITLWFGILQLDVIVGWFRSDPTGHGASKHYDVRNPLAA